MKIYEVWTDSLHKIRYSLGHYLKKETAQRVYENIEQTAAGPVAGIDEIDVYEE